MIFTLYRLLAVRIREFVAPLKTKAVELCAKFFQSQPETVPVGQGVSPLSQVMEEFLKMVPYPSLKDFKVFIETVMGDLNPQERIALLRADLIGREIKVEGKLGSVQSLYADWTASGRGLQCFDLFFARMKEVYANSHTEDARFGDHMTEVLHDADDMILDSVQAKKEAYFPLTFGTGSSGPAFIIQQILGLAASSKFKDRMLDGFMADLKTRRETFDTRVASLLKKLSEVVSERAEAEKTFMQILSIADKMDKRVQAAVDFHMKGSMKVVQMVQEELQTVADDLFQPMKGMEDVKARLKEEGKLPLVRITPMEHHTSVNPYRDGLCDLKMCDLDESGRVDYESLEKQLEQDLRENESVFFVASAGSNVSGVKLDVKRVQAIVARLRVRARSGEFGDNRQLCLGFDYAAVHGYQPVDFEPIGGDPDTAIDWGIFSPHKLPGGEGSSGVGVFSRELYGQMVTHPASGMGGGTVDYVGLMCKIHAHLPEVREKSGTPGPLQNARSAMSSWLKMYCTEAIDHQETAHLKTVFELHEKSPVLRNAVEMVQVPHAQKGGVFEEEDQMVGGLEDEGVQAPRPSLVKPRPEERVGILSYITQLNKGGAIIPVEGSMDLPPLVSPSLLATIMDDFLGIQTRAGCSCAGPYGHLLFNLLGDKETRMSEWATSQHTDQKGDVGIGGVKPGWERWNAHPTMTKSEIEYFMKTLELVVGNINRLMPLYDLDPASGKWSLNEDRFAACKGDLPPREDMSGKPLDECYKIQLNYFEAFVERLEEPDASSFERLPGISELDPDLAFMVIHKDNLTLTQRQVLAEKQRLLSSRRELE